MKTKILLISAAAILTSGAALHLGNHEPKCLMKLFGSGKTAETSKAETCMAAKK